MFQVGDIITGKQNNGWSNVFSSHATLQIKEISDDRYSLEILDIDLEYCQHRIGTIVKWRGKNPEQYFVLAQERKRIMIKW